MSTNSDGFGPLVLPEGTQILAYRVAVEDDKVAGQVWSPEATVRYRVNMRPIARFELRGHGVQEDGSLYDVTNENLTLDGRGSYDPDGQVVAWQWRIDGNVIDCTDPVCVVNDLSVRQHNITLRVQDNDSAWSLDPVVRRARQSTSNLSANEPDYKSLEVTQVPVLILYGYGFFPDSEPWSKLEALARYLENYGDGYIYRDSKFPFTCISINGIRIDMPSYDYGNVFMSNYSCSSATRGNLIDYAGHLDREVRLIRQWTGADKVDIVGYSTGGNVARWYTRFIDDDHVRNLIVIGTPNHGQATTYWTKIGLGIVLGPMTGPLLNDFIWGEAAAMQEPHSNFLKTLNGNGKVFVSDHGSPDQLAPGVDQHHVIHGHLPDRSANSKVLSIGKWEFSSCVEWDWDLSCKRIHKWVIWYPEFHTGDGGAPLKIGDVTVFWMPIMSASGGARLDNVPSYSEALDHLALQEDQTVYEDVLQLLLGTKIRNPATVTNEQIEPGMPAYWTIPIKGTVSASQIVSYPIEIDSTTTQASFQISSPESNLSVVLQTPDGRLIRNISERKDSITVLSKTTQEEVRNLEYEIDNPQSGTWHVIVTGSALQSTKQSFQVSALMETTVGLAVGTEKQEYLPNDPLQVFAIARDVMSSTSPITLTDGLLIARIEKPDGQIEAIHLYDDGTHTDALANDGVFMGTYTDTAQIGAYYVAVAGQYAYNGETILRKAGTRMEVEADVRLALTTGNLGPRRSAVLGTTRSVLKANQTTDLIAYIHNDGQDDAHDVLVHFYDGDPTQEGLFLGETRVDIPGEQTVAARLPWRATQGVHDLHVLVDPYNFLMQRVEGGLEGALNARMATSVRMTAQDTTPPTADPGPSFTIPYSTPVRFDGLDSTDNVGVVTYTWEVDLSSIGRGTVELDGPMPVLVGHLS